MTQLFKRPSMRIRKAGIILTLTVLGSVLLFSDASSQAPKPTPQEIQQQMDTMGPMMGKMMENMYAGLLRTLAKPETADQLATFMMNYRNALVAKGFTKDEAMAIVRAAGIPGMPSTR